MSVVIRKQFSDSDRLKKDGWYKSNVPGGYEKDITHNGKDAYLAIIPMDDMYRVYGQYEGDDEPFFEEYHDSLSEAIDSVYGWTE